METHSEMTERIGSRLSGGLRPVSALFVLAMLLLFGASSAASEPGDPARVLVLYSFRYGLPANELMDANEIVGSAIRSTLDEGTAGRTAIYSAHMDISGVSDTEYLGQLRDTYRDRYAGVRFDLVIAVNYRALDFLNKHGETLWPKTPIVFCGVEEGRRKQLTQLRPNITGVFQDARLEDTLDTILKIHPDTQRIAVIAGTSETDRFIEGIARRGSLKYGDRIDFIHLAHLGFDAMLNSVAKLPANSIVLFLSLLQDGECNPAPVHELHL